MSRFRNVNTVSLLGSAIEGVQRIGVQGGSTAIDYEGDDDAGIQDIGVTKRFATITAEVKDGSKRRDISDPQFTDKAGSPTTTALNEVLTAEMALEGQAVQDSAEADTWLTYIGVRSVRGACDLECRDVDQALGAVLPIGVRGKVDFDLLTPLSTSGLPSTNATNVEMDNLVLESLQLSNPHGELADARLQFGGYGASGSAPVITSAAIPKAPGDTGTLSFVAVSATGGTDKTITISNCVMVRVRARAEHGGIFMVTYEMQAYSSDGSTSPIAVT